MLETAKFNVLTAHSTREALDLFHLFPNISMAILVGDDGIDCDVVAGHLKNTTDKIPVVFLSARIGGLCHHADHNLPTGEPENLVNLVRSLLGDPRQQDTPFHLEHADRNEHRESKVHELSLAYKRRTQQW